MSTVSFIVYDESTGLFRLSGLVKDVGGAKSFVNNAVVKLLTITDSAGANVLGSEVTLNYIAASSGNYEASHDIDLEVGATYEAKLVAAADGLKKTWFLNLIVEKDSGK